MVLISAIVCTHNRAHYLGGAIDSLLAQQFAGEFEAIVVDNASSDQTRAVVESRLSPQLRYVYEPQLGLSIARNTGAKFASSSILAYLDDDAIASPRWLQTLYDAFVQHSDLAIAGGRVTLLWPDGVTAPRWLSEGLMQSLGAYDLGAECVWIDRPGQTPRGLNYAIRKSMLESIGGFDINLGRIGKNLLSNEELYATEQVLQLGGRVAYLPQAQVAHHVAPERLQPSWFLRRNWWQGISDCYRQQAAQVDRRQQLQQGSDRLVRGCVKAIRHLHQPARCFDNLVYAYGQIAYLKTCLQPRSAMNSADLPSTLNTLPLSVLVPVKNEETNLPACLASLTRAAEIFVVDSHSVDRTVEIAEHAGAIVTQFEFSGGWPKKKNWALDTLPFRHEWVLIVDADERIPPDLWSEIAIAIQGDRFDGYHLKRKVIFLGRWLRHGGKYPDLNLRLFRHRLGRYENLQTQNALHGDNEVHEHIILERDGIPIPKSRIGLLNAPMLHEDFRDLYHWIDRHNRYSNWEAQLYLNFLNGRSDEGMIRSNFFGNPLERKRFLRRVWVWLPFRPTIRFLTVYFLMLGFLDGKAGYIHARLISQYEYQISVKLYELQRQKRMRDEG